MSTLNSQSGKRRGVVVAGLAVTAAAMLASCSSGEPPWQPPGTTVASEATPSAAVAVAPDLRNATFDVPSFPGTKACPAGKRTFASGRVSLPETEVSPVTLVLMGEPVLGDVDSDGRAEVLTAIGCQEYTPNGQVLALKLADDGKLSPLGFVLRSADHPVLEVDTGEPIVVSAGVVTVAVLSPGVPDGGHNILEQQQRGYRYEGGSFRQVSGPAKFATPPTDAAKLDVRNETVMLQAGAGWDIVKLRDGSGRAVFEKGPYEVKVKQAVYVPAKKQWIVVYEFKSPQGVAEDAVLVYEMENLRVLADNYVLVLKTGDDAILGIDQVEVQGDLYKVTVRTAGGTEARMYRNAFEGMVRWVRA